MGNWDQYGPHNVDKTITVRVCKYGPHNVDRTITVRVCDESIYLFHPADHYDLVGFTVKVPKKLQ